MGSDGRPVINATAVIGAIREQLKIETQYRAMFGVDLATRPAPVFDEDALLKLAEIRVAQRQLAAQAAPVALPAPTSWKRRSSTTEPSSDGGSPDGLQKRENLAGKESTPGHLTGGAGLVLLYAVR